jgi:hypothetical protein
MFSEFEPHHEFFGFSAERRFLQSPAGRYALCPQLTDLIFEFRQGASIRNGIDVCLFTRPPEDQDEFRA